MTSPTAGQVRKNVLHETMDAIARNDQQSRIVFNPSLELDSLVELVVKNRPYIPAADYAQMIALSRALLDSNSAERVHERHVAGFADQMATTMRQRECNGHRESRA